MRGSIHPARLTRSWRAHLLAAALLLGVVSVAGCTGSSGTTPRSTAAAAGVVSDCLAGSQSQAACFVPHLFQAEYGILPLLARGIDGRGETVTVLAPVAPRAVPSFRAWPSCSPSPCSTPPGGPEAQAPDAFPAGTDIRQDLAAFDSIFGLPAARIQVVTSLIGSASPWNPSDEEVGDTEIVHAVAPAATLRVVLLPANVLAKAANATADILAGLRLAVSGTDVALISVSVGEHFFTRAQVAQMHSILLGAVAHHVTVVASSGDNGGFSDTWFGGTAVKEVSLPASDPLVLGVGSTTLTGDPSGGGYVSETAWNGQTSFVQTSGASGGGFSHRYARPSYQDGVHGTSTMRGVPDVAGETDQQGGWAFLLAGGGKRWIVSDFDAGAATPLWGGLMALADQDAHHDLGFVNPAIYRVARSSSYHSAFHDITTGSNVITIPYPGGSAGYQAGPGWDPVTGWGTPDAQVLVPLLAA